MDKTLKLAILILAGAALVFSCREERPKDVLTKQEMVQVMKDLYIAEEKINRLAISRDSAKRVATLLNDKIFTAAATTDSVFRVSIDYYMARPREMEQIYTALVDTLQLMEHRAPNRVDEP